MKQTELEGVLLKILDKVTAIEAATVGASKMPKTSADAILREKLDHLTLKRHAVLTATLGDVGYAEIAGLMKCDVTTVKLNLKASMTALDIASRDILLTSHKRMLDVIPEAEYVKRYGISKRWWLENNQELMDLLSKTKASANQYTKEKV